MSALATPVAARIAAAQPARWRQPLVLGENALLGLALAAIVLLPLAEIVLRKTFNTGIAGSAALVQHLTLVASMIGAARSEERRVGKECV